MIGPDEDIVPSLMFHSVGLNASDWVWRDLSESLDSFEGKLQLFQKHKCRTVFWADVYQHVSGTTRLPARTLMLTFDDGYLDNWVLVWPLLKKYGMRATIFISADFIEPEGPLRPTLENVWNGELSFESLQVAGFLRPAEIRKMVESGVVDVQSHASSHTWVFVDRRLVDVYDSAKYRQYPWLAWNARPARKPFYLNEDQSRYVPRGEPIFPHRKALVATQFIPDRATVEEFRFQWNRLCEESPSTGQMNVQDSLRKLLERIGLADEWPGAVESADERNNRIFLELKRSRDVLAAITGRGIDFLCWPGGAYDEVAVRVARQCGFKGYTLGSSDASPKRNRPGEDPETLKRIGTGNRLLFRGVDYGERSAFYHWIRVRAHQNSLPHRIGVSAYKLAALCQRKLSIRRSP